MHLDIRMLDIPERRPTRPVDASIAMINIVFLLLLFFIAVGTVKLPEPEGLEPPESSLLRQSGSTDRALYVQRNGELIYLGKKTTTEKFVARFMQSSASKRIAGNKVKMVRVISDRQLEARRSINILSALEKAGLRNLIIVTRRKQLQ